MPLVGGRLECRERLEGCGDVTGREPLLLLFPVVVQTGDGRMEGLLVVGVGWVLQWPQQTQAERMAMMAARRSSRITTKPTMLYV